MSDDHTFKTIRDEAGEIVKIKASISNYKDITVNSFNNKSYMHLSDVSKCFTKGGGFDLKMAKSVTLNRDEVNTFIEMTEKLPSVMDKVLKVKLSSRRRHDSASSIEDSDESKQNPSKRQKMKRQTTGSNSETTTESQKSKNRQLLNGLKRRNRE